MKTDPSTPNNVSPLAGVVESIPWKPHRLFLFSYSCTSAYTTYTTPYISTGRPTTCVVYLYSGCIGWKIETLSFLSVYSLRDTAEVLFDAYKCAWRGSGQYCKPTPGARPSHKLELSVAALFLLIGLRGRPWSVISAASSPHCWWRFYFLKTSYFIMFLFFKTPNAFGKGRRTKDICLRLYLLFKKKPPNYYTRMMRIVDLIR